MKPLQRSTGAGLFDISVHLLLAAMPAVLTPLLPGSTALGAALGSGRLELPLQCIDVRARSTTILQALKLAPLMYGENASSSAHVQALTLAYVRAYPYHCTRNGTALDTVLGKPRPCWECT